MDERLKNDVRWLGLRLEHEKDAAAALEAKFDWAFANLMAASKKLEEIRKHVKLPVGVGFGIRDAQSARAIAAHADAVVIGSRIIQEIESGPAADAASRAGAWLGTIRTALDARA